MPRNFDRRVEVMFPVEAEDLRRRIVEEIIPDLSQRQPPHARCCWPTARYARAEPRDGERRTAARSSCLQLAARAAGTAGRSAPTAARRPRFRSRRRSQRRAVEREKKKKKDKLKDKKSSASPR